MKRFLVAACCAALLAATAHAALDATLLQNVTLLPVTSAPVERKEAELLAGQNFTTNATVTGGGYAASGYFGKGQIVLTFSGNDDAAYTNVATIAQGPSAESLTNTIATVAHGGDALGVTIYEIDFDALTQSHWGVTFAAATDNSKAYRFGADLIYDGVPTAGATITGSAVDRTALTGTAAIHVNVGAGKAGASTFATSVQIQHANASTGVWVNVTGATATVSGASGGAAVIPYDATSGLKYLRAVLVQTNDVADVNAVITSYK
jgi:hypothetical protein